MADQTKEQAATAGAETAFAAVKRDSPPADAPAQPPASGPPAPAQPPPVNISCTRGLAHWLLQNQVSLAFTSYQTGRLYLVGVNNKGQVSFHERFLARAMGLWADPQRLVVSTLFQVWRFENVLGPNPPAGAPDRHYVPRVAHTTGDLDIHDIGVMADGRIVFVNSLFSCLATLLTHARLPRPLEAAVHLETGGRGPLPLQRPRHEGRRARLCDGDEPQRQRQRLARPARGGRMRCRCQ